MEEWNRMNIFCSGIGGIGLSAYAAYQKASGHTVSGSDRAESDLTKALQKEGITVSLKQDGSAVPSDTGLFVYTLALPSDHPERLHAEKLRIPQKTYFEALGDLVRESGKPLIAVCGTHGKSSTTAMAAKVFIDALRNPSVILGTKTKDLQGRNFRKGAGEQWIVEACEYHRSFLHLSPTIILLTNADGDHFDAFKDLTDYQKAFQEFVEKLPKDGILITHCSDPGLQSIIHFARERGVRVVDADVFALPSLSTPGHHMQSNAQLVLALADVLSIPHAEKALKGYAGSWRRMEVKGETKGGVIVIDDYGHHPAEVRATLQGIRERYPERRLLCVFQPHTHDRTIKLYEEFLSAFAESDIVILSDVYDARPQSDMAKVDMPKFVSDIAKESKVEVIHGGSLDNTLKTLQTMLHKNDLVISMGAGDVGRIAQQLTSDN